MGKSITGLTVKPRHIAVVSILSAMASVGTLYAVALTTVFPVPFMMLLASPPSIVVFGACFVYFWGTQVQQDPSIEVDMKREQAVSRCQVALTFVYPLYIAGFMSLSGVYQTMSVAVLPLIKLVARNWVAHALKDHNDLKPQAVTFIVEVFSALYVSNALSSSSSWMGTAMIMTLDAVVVVQSTRDIMEVLSDVKLLMAKNPQTHPVAKENFVHIAVRLMAIEADKLPQTLNRLGEVPKRSRTSQPQPVRIGSSKVHASAAVYSSTTATSQTTGDSLENIFSKEKRALFIHRIATVLFITEFIILAEYVELMLPVAYGLHHFVLYHLPNCAYYPALAILSSAGFSESNSRMVVYCFLEFISLMMVILLLRRVLGFSTLCQLAFVLKMQAGIIQTQLISLLLYIMQLSLAHIGADFTFRFAWLHGA
ncbi:hypothetical protein PHYSODRAFT_519377 [Phytophthora sojae]|uniref:Transmembrane protein n=1 Tax=Phytophthora sojae (strain P6497) TaxID=1094619 RepID=G5A0M5_PHYSP|nr:hypothetical protein PHYSODRAFT_519377 [Phytophthora sojae]EGZ10561.1 hypothetical protein PHYSODRAFT_519377 [Phytophthora sojae]|eukprot:XP_009533306.1 hypothetical protein PHYSODRAFT_519377 [Phytophthora sojae]